MSTPVAAPSLSLLTFPYQTLRPIEGDRAVLKAEGRRPGAALVWQPTVPLSRRNVRMVHARPGGLALLVILPPSADIGRDVGLLTVLTDARPQSVLPHHLSPSPAELAQVLQRPPEDLAVELTDYLAWRGIEMDRETRHLVRRVVELSADLRSVSALSRSLYVSRRALGRRFMSQGLPVPSHWLHFARLLRVAIRLQNSDESVLSLGYGLGYPDGFSVSNQMYRLTGYRPSDVRRFLGWEWLVEAWLRCEADAGGLSPTYTERFLAPPAAPSPPSTAIVRRLEPSPSEVRKSDRSRKAAG